MAVEKSLTKNAILQSMEGKKIEQIQGMISRRRKVLNRTIQVVINRHINMSILACIAVEKSLTKHFILQSIEGKRIGQIQARINRRRLNLNARIQQVVINLHIKYEHSSMYCCGEIFDETFHLSNYGRKENWTNTGKNGQEKVLRNEMHHRGFVKIKTSTNCG